jgi:WD40 repeat protein
LTTFTERLRFTLPAEACSNTRTFFLHGPRLVLSSSVWDISRAWDQLEKGPSGGRDLPSEEELFARVVLEQEAHTTSMAFVTAEDMLVGTVWSAGHQQRTQVVVWGPDGKCRRALDVADFRWGGPLALAPDGRLLAACGFSNRAMLLDLADGNPVAELAHTDDLQVLRFSPDGRLLAVAVGRTVWLWDVAARAVLASFPAFQRYAKALAFDRSGRFLAAGSREGEVRLWDMADCKQVACLDWKIGAVHGLAFSPDGMTVAAAGHNGTLVIWDLE